VDCGNEGLEEPPSQEGTPQVIVDAAEAEGWERARDRLVDKV
jgi:hypothetical protein